MLREIVSEILDAQQDMEVLPARADELRFSEAAEPRHVDVVVLGRDDPTFASTLLKNYPGITVLAVCGEGSASWLYELRPHRIELGEVSPEQLVDAIRTASGRC